jgi:drug/metabolite transporter (DMT)-like permease
MKPVFLILLIGMNLLWAGTPPIYKVLAQHLSSGSIATMRFGLAALCLLALWPWLPGRGPRGVRDLLRVIIMGAIVFAAAPRLQIEGVHRGQAGDTSLLIALEPLFVALAAAVFLRERIAPRRWWGFGLGMIGVVLLSNIWGQEIEPLHGLIANLLFVSSFVCETAYSVMGKPLLERSGALKLLGAAALAGTVVNLLLDWLNGTNTLAAAQTLPLNAWALMLYLAIICSVAGYSLWYVVIRETEVNVTGLTVFVQPLAGFALAVIWLKEPVHAGQFWGSLVIVAGLIVGLRRDGVRQMAPPAPVANENPVPSMASLESKEKEIAE